MLTFLHKQELKIALSCCYVLTALCGLHAEPVDNWISNLVDLTMEIKCNNSTDPLPLHLPRSVAQTKVIALQVTHQRYLKPLQSNPDSGLCVTLLMSQCHTCSEELVSIFSDAFLSRSPGVTGIKKFFISGSPGSMCERLLLGQSPTT